MSNYSGVQLVQHSQMCWVAVQSAATQVTVLNALAQRYSYCHYDILDAIVSLFNIFE